MKVNSLRGGNYDSIQHGNSSGTVPLFLKRRRTKIGHVRRIAGTASLRIELQYAGKVRDGEDTIASTRDACATRIPVT
jgi:predicted Zn-dependent protease